MNMIDLGASPLPLNQHLCKAKDPLAETDTMPGSRSISEGQKAQEDFGDEKGLCLRGV